MAKHTKTLKVRVKDKHRPLPNQVARSVNFVWNCINELSSRSIREHGMFVSAQDMHPYTKCAGKELGLHCQTLQCIAGEYVTRRKQFKKARLSWRRSGSVRRSLGWIPINTGAAFWKNGQSYHNGQHFKVRDSWGLLKYKFRSASHNGQHQCSRQLVNHNALIVLGDASSNKLVKTSMAKSVLDAGWGQLKKCWNTRALTQAWFLKS